MKKFVAILVTGVMLLSLCVTAFAATPATTATEKSESLTVGAVTAVPNIKVTMPKLGKNPVVINPYKLTYSQQVNGADLATPSDDQVISPVYSIKNESDVTLGLDVTVTGTVAGTFALVQPSESVTTNTVQESQKNEAIVKLLVQANVATPADGAAFEELQEAGDAPTANETTKLYDADAVVPIVLDKKAVTAGGTLTCNKPELAEDGKTIVPNNICFQFTGAAASNPKTAWTAADSLTAAIVFSFKPITLASSASTSGSGSTGG